MKEDEQTTRIGTVHRVVFMRVFMLLYTGKAGGKKDSAAIERVIYVIKYRCYRYNYSKYQSEAYVSAVEFGSEHAGVLADKAQEMANHTVDLAKDIVPDKVGNIVASLNDYAITNNLPFRM